MYSINIRSVCSAARRAELQQRLSATRPLIVCLQETWLDESVHELCVSGYKTVSRRDRADSYGGVLFLVREDVEFVVPVCVCRCYCGDPVVRHPRYLWSDLFVQLVPSTERRGRQSC